MQTKIYPATAHETDSELSAIELAGQYIRKGELVGFPTETVYGLGADALAPQAVMKIFTAKGRPADNPLISHVNSLSMAEQLAEFSPLGLKLAAAFWPGPLTMVLAKRDIVPAITTAGMDTVAVRYPRHPLALELIAAAGTPIAAPSANLSGRPSPTTAEHVYEDMAGKIPLILDGGAVEIGLESTVVDARNELPILLRPGMITKEQLAELCGDCLQPAVSADKPLSPGMKYRHYAPKGELYLAADAAEALLISKRLPAPPLFLVSYDIAGELLRGGIPQTRLRRLFRHGDLLGYSQEIFAALRAADSDNEPYIIAESVAETGFGLAIMNRLKKAAAK